MPDNHLIFTPAGVASSLTLAVELCALRELGKEVVVTVDGKIWNPSHPNQTPAKAPQQSFIEELKNEIDRLLGGLAVAVNEVRAADREGRKTSAMLRAVAAEVREIMEPYREMYKDGRVANAKSEALRAGVPELVVDVIVSEFMAQKFPTTGTLMKKLNNAGNMKKLESEGHGTSRATIARWLKTVRITMVQNGVIEKFRVRFEDLPVAPSRSISKRGKAGGISLEEGEAGLTKCDTRGQELGEEYAGEPAD
jgi:hypothetical protein